MGIDLKGFRAARARFSADLQRDVKHIVVGSAVELRDNFARAHPVDTGRSAASWNASARRLNAFKQPETYYGPGPERISAGKIDVDSWRLGDAVHVSNGQEYIWALETGHSKQAPSGFVRIGLDSYAQGVLHAHRTSSPSR